MKSIKLGRTGIIVPQNAFGCLPIQRDTTEAAVKLLREAYDGGMRFFDTARAYTDSEEKVGQAFEGMREKVFIATKTAAKTPEGFWYQAVLNAHTILYRQERSIFQGMKKKRQLKNQRVALAPLMSAAGIVSTSSRWPPSS